MKFVISYAHEDKQFVEELKQNLQNDGFDIWTDHDIESGTTWEPAIDDAIRNAPGIIVVLSPDSMDSLYVTYEWAYALGLSEIRNSSPSETLQSLMIPIVIPLLRKPINLNSWKNRLKTMQYI